MNINKLLSLSLLLLGASLTALNVVAATTSTKPLRPLITGVKAAKCVTPGKSIIYVYGRNFGRSIRKSLVVVNRTARSKVTLTSIKWSNTYIAARVPRSKYLKPGLSYIIRVYVPAGLSSNYYKAFSVCRTIARIRVVTTTAKPVPTRTQPTGPSGSSVTTTPTSPSVPGNNVSPSAPGSGLGTSIPESNSAPEPTVKSSKLKTNFVPRQVLLTSANLKQANKIYSDLQKQGYKIISRRVYKNLGLVLSVFRTPAGVSARDAILTLRSKYKKATVDHNSLYALHAGTSKTDAFMQKINWPTPSVDCGRGFKIGLLDSAVDQSHKAFRSRKLIQKNFVTAGLVPTRRLHGTAISSQWIGNRNSGIAGVIPGATVYAASIFFKKGHQQTSNTALLIQGLDWLVQNRVDVINMSFGGQHNGVLESALKIIMRKNISIVASAGNGGVKGRAAYPAAQSGVVAVTAVTSSNKIYAYATRGSYIDLAAPGVNIWVAKPDNGRKVVSGTSFAAPYVSAALLILKTKIRQHKSRLRWLKKKARRLGSSRVFGKGLLQVPGACQS